MKRKLGINLADKLPKWATQKDESGADDSDSEFETFLASTSVTNALTRFKTEGLTMRRRQDLNIDARSTCGLIRSVAWQSLGKDSISSEPLVAFSSKADKQVRLCRVSENGKSSSIEYALKISNTITPSVIKFISPDELLITNSIKNGKVLLYNVVTEKSHLFSSLGQRRILRPEHIATLSSNVFSISHSDGHILNIDSRTKQLVSEFRLNNACVGLSWSPTGSLFCGDSRGSIYLFESRMNSTSCVMRQQLDTITSMSSFSANSDGSLLACGSPFGTVDVVKSDISSSTDVVHSFDRLTTSVTSLSFHPTVPSLLLASSSDKRNAVRVFECGSGRTLPGWPSEQEPIGRALKTEFSDCGRFLAIACKSGRVQMYAVQQ